MSRVISLLALTVLVALLVPAALAQNAGFDLFQTGSGTSVDLGSPIGTVNLQGVPIQGGTGNTDTIIQRTQNGPGTVNAQVYALFMKSTSPVTFNGQSADVYVTINNSGGTIPTSTLPQPDSLTASIGTVTINSGGTFDSNITVNADLIFVKAGTSVTNSANYLGHKAANSVSLTSSNSSWSSTAPAGYPSSSSFPSGGFFVTGINGGHNAPNHPHAIVPASCGSSGTAPITSQTAKGAASPSNSNIFPPVRNCIAVTQ